MGIAFFSFLSSLSDNWVRWLNPPRATFGTTGSVLRVQSRVTPRQWAINTVNGKSTGLRLNTPKSQASALRVVHLSEAGTTSACAGRMRISGRMADVCAEIDRLIAQETQNLVH